jgi:uncharacterized DUF497 family protein
MSNKTNILLAHCGREDGNIITVISAKEATKNESKN